jgi:hypothetical protein
LRLIGSVNPRRLGGAAACVVVGLVAASAPALVLGGLVLLVLIAVVGLDQLAAARRA